jgi:phospholipase C
VLVLTAALAKAADIPLRHVIIIMQENRSFDHYFGTFPGADGIPAGICVPLDPTQPGSRCIKPFHDVLDVNAGGPHGPNNAQADLDDGISTGLMDGFIHEQANAKLGCAPDAPDCATTRDGVARHDVVGYHDEDEIPNYWAYARHFVLQDHLYEGVRSWSWPSHLELTSEWSAVCTDYTKASTCVTNPNAGRPLEGRELPWANLFQLLDQHGVSWKYYLEGGAQPDCDDGGIRCPAQAQTNRVPSIWNPAPYFTSVQRRGAAYLGAHNPDSTQFFTDLRNGTLPQVAWLIPADKDSEHPPSGVTRGMEYVTRIVNAVMRSSYWNDTVIFIAWDDWGGFYDHVTPPLADFNDTKTPIQGFGLRVPGIMISAYAKSGMIDHSVLSFDSYATFIEDVFMNGARLDPRALGNPDNRPDVRDALTQVRLIDGTVVPVGNLMDEFDFTQPPLHRLELSTDIPTDLTAHCGSSTTQRCTEPVVTISWRRVFSRQLTYHVKRDGKDLPQCAGAATSCTDRPGKGAHLYRAYSVNAKGRASPLSAAAEADEP